MNPFGGIPPAGKVPYPGGFYPDPRTGVLKKRYEPGPKYRAAGLITGVPGKPITATPTPLPVSHIGFARRPGLSTVPIALTRAALAKPRAAATATAGYDPRIGAAYTTDPTLRAGVPSMQGPQAMITDPVTGKIQWWVWGVVAVVALYVIKKYIL